MDNQLTPFENKAIRRVWQDEQWYFAIIDIISVLAETDNPRQYWTKVKKGLLTESQLQPFWLQLKVTAIDGKNYKTDCTNTEGILRIVMSVPSPKAEPLKLWLAEQGKRTIDELNDPELLTERQAEYYSLKGYPKDWIAQRLKNIDLRKELTEEWEKRGIEKNKEYSILTATIAKNTFGLTPSEHAKLKGLEKENLRDHMTNLELLLTSLGEEVTKTIAVNTNAKGFFENQQAAEKGGKTAGEALERVEAATGQKVVSESNFKNLKSGEDDKLLERE